MVKSKVPSSFSSARDAIDVVEELVWVLSSKDVKSLKHGVALLRNAISEKQHHEVLLESPTIKSGSSKLLIGILPQLLADVELFPANQDIEKFAREAFRINITRWDKRSRYEMIGMLVMEVHMLPEDRLSDLVAALTRLISKDEALESLKRVSRQTGFSWNEAIRDLSDL